MKNRSTGSYSKSGTPAPERQNPESSRYISKAIRHKVWQRDENKCTLCEIQKSLNIDRVQPVAFGGGSHIENLRLLCFLCNLRQAMKALGVQSINRHYQTSP